MGVALRGAVQLADVFNVEPLRELGPDLRPQAVAEHHADLVLPLLGPRGLGQQVAADLSNVLGHLHPAGTTNTLSSYSHCQKLAKHPLVRQLHRRIQYELHWQASPKNHILFCLV